MTPQELKLTLTLEDVNVILESLGHMPFMKVYRLIQKIHEQAQQQGASHQGQGGLESTIPN
jgi:hypothetical protein